MAAVVVAAQALGAALEVAVVVVASTIGLGSEGVCADSVGERGLAARTPGSVDEAFVWGPPAGVDSFLIWLGWPGIVVVGDRGAPPMP